MPATVYEFKEIKNPSHICPDFIFLDTNFLIDALMLWERASKHYPRTQASKSFLQELRIKAQQGELCLFTDESAINEFFFFILKNKIKQEYNVPPFDVHIKLYDTQRKDKFTSLVKDHPELIKKYYSLLEAYYNKLKAVPIEILGPEHLAITETTPIEGITESAKKIIDKYQLLPTDAFHIAIAFRAGMSNFVSNDSDFYRVDNITVYTASNKPHKCQVCP